LLSARLSLANFSHSLLLLSSSCDKVFDDF
jgi:hypothetical protein